MPLKEYDINYNNVEFKEYYKNLLWEKNMDEKMDFIAKEVLSYGFNDKKADCTLEEMIAISKFQFLETSSEQRLIYKITKEDENENFKLDDTLINPNNTNEEYKKKEKEFVKNPVKVIKEYAIAEANKEIDEKNPEDVKWKNHCKEMIDKLTNMEATYNEAEKEIQPKIITFLVGRARYNGETKTCNDILKRNKGGFFERFFRTTSNEYKNFKNAFKEYNDKNSPNFGNKEALKSAAMAYIRHKVPSLKENEEPDSNIYDNLEGTSLNRTMLCLSVLDQIKYQEKIENLNNTFNNLSDKANENEQKDFQNNLNNDIEIEMSVQPQVEDTNNVIVNENEIKN